MTYPNLRTAEFKASTMDRKSCEGACDEHQGIPQLVSVTDGRDGKDWGYFKYCDAAIAEDESRGLVVTIEDQA
jgi:hypothetical protein